MLMAEMLSERKRLMEEAEKYYSDKWVTGKELTKLYPCFSINWLRRNGQYLPRTRVYITLDDGKMQCSQWGYSLNRIEKYIKEGYIKIDGVKFYFNKDRTAFNSIRDWL